MGRKGGIVAVSCDMNLSGGDPESGGGWNYSVSNVVDTKSTRRSQLLSFLLMTKHLRRK